MTEKQRRTESRSSHSRNEIEMISQQQEDALKAIKSWRSERRPKPFFYLAGYAGTGKTTIARLLEGEMQGRVVYGAFTGKAADVMRAKGCAGAMTIHSLIMRPRSAKGQVRFELNEESIVAGAGLVVIDEGSMLDDVLVRDLLSFGTPLLVLGDPMQLAPVSGQGYFATVKPDFQLTEIHRQAEHNPIIRLATDLRFERLPALGSYGESRIMKRSELDAGLVLSADKVLVGRNATRRQCNERWRELQGFRTKLPAKGEKLVCLANDRPRGFWNGGLWDVLADAEIDGEAAHIKLAAEGSSEPRRARIRSGGLHEIDPRGRFDSFDFGYALTVHKAQGSQWDHVLILDESDTLPDRFRWLYTALTRASQRVTWAR